MFLSRASSIVSRRVQSANGTRILSPVANSHTLVVPTGHDHPAIAVTPFQSGVPVKQVRDLAPAEKNWDFWTTSDAFAEARPESGLRTVPYGEAWVIEAGGSKKLAKEGSSTLLAPGLGKVKAVKNTHTISMGIVTPAIAAKDGTTVNAYAVTYIKVVDFVKSVYYIDPESNRNDSERAAAKLVRRVLEQEVPNLSSATVSDSEKAKLAEKITSALSAKSEEFGIEVVGVEIRGVFSSTSNVPDKLRALDPPARDPEAPGHGLSADYWAEVLTPPYFEKKKFGTRKDVRTPATVTLEWVIPSPPDYHHFNQVPKMLATPAPVKGAKVPEKAHH